MEQLITVFYYLPGGAAQMAIVPADVKGGLAVHKKVVYNYKKEAMTSTQSYTITHVASGFALSSLDMTHKQALELRKKLIEEAERIGFDWTKDAEYVRREGQWCMAVIRGYLENTA
jgi:hypothetical protein